MKQTSNLYNEKYQVTTLPKNVVKLSLLSLLFFTVYCTPGFVTSKLIEKDKTTIRASIFFIVSFPFLLTIFYLIRYSRRGRVNLGELANIRFCERFPLLLLYDPCGLHSRFKDDSIKTLLQKGDIILRRNAFFLDSLVLNQTSFFTHAAICIDTESNEPEIAHAIGANGVSIAKPFKNFIRSEEVAILRLQENELLNFDNELQLCSLFLADKNIKTIKLENKLRQLGKKETTMSRQEARDFFTRNSELPFFNGVFSNHYVKINVGSAIYLERKVKHGTIPLSPGPEQLEIFESLKLKSPVSLKKCINVFSKMFLVYEGRKYDYFFNFSDIDKMSCVEFVWYCFKSVFPVHKVQETQIKWFKQFGPLAVDTLVILPDDFIRSPAFELVYTSVRNDYQITNKEELLKHLDTHKLNPLKFMFKLVGLQIIAISAFWGVYSLSKEVGLNKPFRG